MLLALIFTLTATAALALTTPSIAGRIQSQNKTDSFEYSIQGDKAQSIYVTVGVNMEDIGARQAYLDANVERNQKLLEDNLDDLIPVQVTFAHPVAVANVKALVASTGFTVDSFLLVGHSTISQQRGTHIQFSSLDDSVPEREIIDPVSGEEIVFEGIMVLQGIVPANSDGLGQWMKNDSVYLLDSSEVEMSELLSRQYANEIAGKDVEISLPSPFWDLDW